MSVRGAHVYSFCIHYKLPVIKFAILCVYTTHTYIHKVLKMYAGLLPHKST